jgi:Holliday junction resolvase RusA-like endonuclease
MEKPWAVYITWPKFPTPVKSGEYSNRISAEMSKQWLEKKLQGYLKMEVVWIDDERQPPASLRRSSSNAVRHSHLTAVQVRRIEQ